LFGFALKKGNSPSDSEALIQQESAYVQNIVINWTYSDFVFSFFIPNVFNVQINKNYDLNFFYMNEDLIRILEGQ